MFSHLKKLGCQVHCYYWIQDKNICKRLVLAGTFCKESGTENQVYLFMLNLVSLLECNIKDDEITAEACHRTEGCVMPF